MNERNGSHRWNWFETAGRENRRLFPELETLLKALDRFFFLDFSPTDRDFGPELVAVRDVILRMQLILESVIPASIKNEYRLHKYAEASLLRGIKRDMFKQEILSQDTPGQSLVLLYDSFLNLRTVADDLLKNKKVTYSSFRSLGNIVGTRIRDNAFFNPFAKDIDPGVDSIDNRDISGIVKNISDRDSKMVASTILLRLFQFLRYLSYCDLSSYRRIVLSSSLLIVFLLKSEIGLLLDYIEKAGKKIKDKEFSELLRLMSYQFTMDTKRIYVQELKGVFDKPVRQMWAKVDVSCGILRNLLEHSAIQTVQLWKPELNGGDIFDGFFTQADLSSTLREDVYTLDRLVTMLLENPSPSEQAGRIFKVLKNYGEHFEGLTFKLIRYDDYQEFAAFMEMLKDAEYPGEGFDAFLDKCRYFKVFLDTLLGHLSNRAEIAGKAFDHESAEGTVKLLLKTGG